MVLVNVCGDTVVEPDETFTVHLSNAVNGSITSGDGLGTIQNNTTPGGAVRIGRLSRGRIANGGHYTGPHGRYERSSTVTFATSNGTAHGRVLPDPRYRFRVRSNTGDI